jgi:hypothetical protein
VVIPVHVAAYAAGIATAHQPLSDAELAAWIEHTGMGKFPPKELADAADAWLIANVSPEMRKTIEAMARHRT